MNAASIRDALASLVYPKRAVCMGCGSVAGFSRDWLCDDCRTALAELWLGAQPLPEVPEVEGAAFAYRYIVPVRGVVRQLKYGGMHRLADFMAADMARALDAIQPTGADVIVPVPMHPRRVRRRGYNHAALLARGLSRRTGIPCEEALSRTRNARQQAKLNRRERQANLKNAFACGIDLTGRRVLLVDDVCTTGATLSECAQTLKAAGAQAVYAICYARAELLVKEQTSVQTIRRQRSLNAKHPTKKQTPVLSDRSLLFGVQIP